AKAFQKSSDLSAAEIAEKSLQIAADICIYTNDNISVEQL
ncbi:MAG: HslU--HslV peptidase proteolytic subunit, partial [Bacillota bacterium]